MDNSREIENFLHNIAYLRRQHGLSKQEMARRLEIGVHSLNMIEEGILPPRMGISIIYAIYHHFGLLPSVLVSRKLDDPVSP